VVKIDRFIKGINFDISMSIDFEDLETQVEERGKVIKLDNGVVITAEDWPGSGLAIGTINVLAGSTVEKEGDEGIMHFIEHMSWRASQNYPNDDEKLSAAASLGLGVNANTTLEGVNFPINGANESNYMLASNFLEASRLIIDSIHQPLFLDESIELEKGIIGTEILREENKRAHDPSMERQRVIHQCIFPNSPELMSTELAGSQESIQGITAQRLKEYHKKYFRGSNIIAGLVADFSSNPKLLDQICDLFSKIPKGVETPFYLPKVETPFEDSTYVDINVGGEGHMEAITYFYTPPIYHPEFEKIKGVAHLLGGNCNSLLYRNLRLKNGISYEVNALTGGTRSTGTLSVFFNTPPDNFDQAMGLTSECINALREGTFNEEMLEAYKTGYLPQFMVRLKDPGWIQVELQQRELGKRMGIGTPQVETVKQLLSLTKEDIVGAANTYLTRDHRILKFL
tara:strand:+ start:7858 stop:9225 length:1368 start_codon:yes stop_codon:yes gene_type:complete